MLENITDNCRETGRITPGLFFLWRGREGYYRKRKPSFPPTKHIIPSK